MGGRLLLKLPVDCEEHDGADYCGGDAAEVDAAADATQAEEAPREAADEGTGNAPGRWS